MILVESRRWTSVPAVMVDAGPITVATSRRRRSSLAIPLSPAHSSVTKSLAGRRHERPYLCHSIWLSAQKKLPNSPRPDKTLPTNSFPLLARSGAGIFRIVKHKIMSCALPALTQNSGPKHSACVDTSRFTAQAQVAESIQEWAAAGEVDKFEAGMTQTSMPRVEHLFSHRKTSGSGYRAVGRTSTKIKNPKLRAKCLT